MEHPNLAMGRPYPPTVLLGGLDPAFSRPTRKRSHPVAILGLERAPGSDNTLIGLGKWKDVRCDFVGLQSTVFERGIHPDVGCRRRSSLMPTVALTTHGISLLLRA